MTGVPWLRPFRHHNGTGLALDRYKRGLPYIGPALKIQAGVVLGSDDANKSGKK